MTISSSSRSVSVKQSIHTTFSQPCCPQYSKGKPYKLVDIKGAIISTISTFHHNLFAQHCHDPLFLFLAIGEKRLLK